MSIKSFTDMIVWQRAREATLSIYEITRSFPWYEQLGLTQQMRKAAVSVAANIAEGFGRRSRADKARIYNFAEGSCEELKYFLILGPALHYMKTEPLLNGKVEEVSRMLRALVGTTLDS